MLKSYEEMKARIKIEMDGWSSNLVSVIIVSCNNNKNLLATLLRSLGKQSYKQLEKIAVLNTFSKEETEDLSRDFRDVRFILNKENLFYCKAQNQGIRAAKGEFILCLNDDLILEVDFIEEMVRAAKKDEKIGMVSGYIMRQDKKNLVDTAGLFLARSRKPLERGFNQKRNNRYKVAEYIFGSGGVAPLYRRNMLENIKIGNEYFDEDYDMFYEDLDISWRAQNRDWKGYYTPEACAYHLRGATAKKMKPRFSFLERYNFTCLPGELKLRLLKNRYMTIIKNDNFRCLLLNLPWILGYEIKIWLYLILFEPILAWRILKDLSFAKVGWRRRKELRGADSETMAHSY